MAFLGVSILFFFATFLHNSLVNAAGRATVCALGLFITEKAKRKGEN